MDERLERYAELVVRVGANVQPGQEVFLYSAVEHHDLTRALARQAYRAGAAYVNVLYTDGHVRRAMIELGPDEALTYSPDWLKNAATSFAGNASSRRRPTPTRTCWPTSTASASGGPCSRS